MSNILIITSFYNINGANSICTRNLVNEFLKEGHKVFVLTDENPSNIVWDDNVKIYIIKQQLYRKFQEINAKNQSLLWKVFFKSVSVIRYLFAVPLFPNVAPLSSKIFLKKAIKITICDKIDIVVGVHRSYEPIYTVQHIKRKFKDNIIGITYHLDLICSFENKNRYVRNYKRKKAFNSISKELKYVDRLIAPLSAKDNKISNQKIAYADFPVYTNLKTCNYDKLPFLKNEINLVYIGSLDIKNRNPISIVKFFYENVKMVHDKKIVFHFWGNIPDMELKNELENYSNVRYHGLVENKYVGYILENSDFLLNIGNKYTTEMIPSKIFTILTTGKPIINVVRSWEDKSIRYFTGKNQVFMFDETKELFDETISLMNFLTDNYGKVNKIDPKDYFMNTPKYTVDLMLNTNNKGCK